MTLASVHRLGYAKAYSQSMQLPMRAQSSLRATDAELVQRVKKAQFKISIPGGFSEGFKIGFSGQVYECIGFRDHICKSGEILPLVMWKSICAKCGGEAFMDSKHDDLRPSQNCAPCRALSKP